jgi:WD40 repeat protein
MNDIEINNISNINTTNRINNTNKINNINDGILIKREDIFKKSEFKLYSPTILLQAHKSDVFTGKFSREGFLFASAGYDRDINIWETFNETCRNITTLRGHTNAILELVWSQDDSKVFTSSADKTVSVWDIYQCERIKKFKGHEGFVNCIDTTKKGEELVNNIIYTIKYYHT